MYRNILIATDGSDVAERAVEQGLGLAKATGAGVTAVTVTDRFPTSSGVLMPRADDIDLYEGAVAKEAEVVLSRVSSSAKAAGVDCRTVHVKDQDAADGILQAARENDCDLIVMATHGRRGMQRLLLGSQAARVMSGAPVPVLICR